VHTKEQCASAEASTPGLSTCNIVVVDLCSWVCNINDGILHPLLAEEDVWKGVLDILDTNVVGFIGNGLESWDG
jgi:hypothetical protein